MPISLPVIIPDDKSAVLYLFTNASFNARRHILLIRPQSNIVLQNPLLLDLITPVDKAAVLYFIKTALSTPVITPVD